jgi:uncharacterized protein
MKHTIRWLLVTVAACLPAFAATAQTNSPLIQFGEAYTLHSKILNEDRPYWVYLPPSYKPTRNHAPQKYPVLYLTDGESSFPWACEVVQFMGDMLQIPELIVVAIPNTDRNRDLTPTHDSGIASSGGGPLFENFLSRELAPEIDSKFRTVPYRILFSHSLGGALAADSFLRQTNGFQACIAVDPALWWDNAILLHRAKEFVPATNSHAAIFIATANHFGEQPPNLIKGDSERFLSVLKAKAAPNLRLGYEYFEAEDHASSRLPGLRDGLRFIFEDYKPENFGDPGLDDAPSVENHFKELSERLGFEMTPPEAYVDKIGSWMLDAHQTDKAIGLFQLNVANYPAAASDYAHLAEAYVAKGEKDLAIKNYEKAAELNPRMGSAKRALEKLQQ